MFWFIMLKFRIAILYSLKAIEFGRLKCRVREMYLFLLWNIGDIFLCDLDFAPAEFGVHMNGQLRNIR
jgi:hypothetical protein